MKKALVAVSFGTTHTDAGAAIASTELALSLALPEYEVMRAFTSQMVTKKLFRDEGILVPAPAELVILPDGGYDEVLFQSLHIIAGNEYDKLCTQVAPHKVGKPLLYSVKDYLDCRDALLPHMPDLNADEAFVYMGHGSEHPMNAAYSQLENAFRAKDIENVVIGTVEGFPGFDYVLRRLKMLGASRIYLAPLMLTAGDHAKNDLAGESPDSWASRLRGSGYDVTVLLQGLGGFKEIQNIFVRHAVAASL